MWFGDEAMTELVTKEMIAEYEAFLESHPEGHFAQSSLWMISNSDLSVCCAHANVGRGHALAGAGIIVFAENSHKNGTCYCRKGHALSLQYKYELTDKSEFIH